jgi:hypothetical protein
MDAVRVQRDEPYRTTDAGALTLDLYYPPQRLTGATRPAVIFVTGYPDSGAERMLGSKFKDMGSFVSWAQLLAASGIVGITYANNEPADVHHVVRHIRENAAALGVDRDRLAIWACSGHAPSALSILVDQDPDRFACAALIYPYTVDLDGSTGVAAAAAQFRFATPAAGNTVVDMPGDLPVCIVRAGRDRMPSLNEALDRFVAASLARNLPLTLINHPLGEHAFDLSDDSPMAHAAIGQALAFLHAHLLTPLRP